MKYFFNNMVLLVFIQWSFPFQFTLFPLWNSRWLGDISISQFRHMENGKTKPIQFLDCWTSTENSINTQKKPHFYKMREECVLLKNSINIVRSFFTLEYPSLSNQLAKIEVFWYSSSFTHDQLFIIQSGEVHIHCVFYGSK
jgi:hypothetical protein